MRPSEQPDPVPAEASQRSRRVDGDGSLAVRLAAASAIAVLVLVPFSLLALLVLGAWPPLSDLDQAVTEALHSYAISHPGWVSFMAGWSTAFDPTVLRAGVLVLVVWLWWRDARRLALWVATTMVVGGLLGALLKLLVGRHRPDLLEPVARAAGFSFPSGHALNATLTAGVLLLVFLPFARDRRPLRWAMWVAALVLAIVTGVSRVALGVHWASDVVGGWLLGVAVVAATAAGFAGWRERAGYRPVRTVREGVEPDLPDERRDDA